MPPNFQIVRQSSRRLPSRQSLFIFPVENRKNKIVTNRKFVLPDLVFVYDAA
jgi:hypothetical protein